MDPKVIIVGAGPVGLAAGAHFERAGWEPLILEAGPGVGDTIRDWGHVRVFTDWQSVIDHVAAGMLTENGWTFPPPGDFPTGLELVEEYLEPLGRILGDRILFDHRVMAIAKDGRDKLVDAGRDGSRFVVRAQHDEQTTEFTADFVIDASGTWLTPNPLGADGLPAVGESEATNLRYGIPDVLGRERSRYVGRRTLVVGAGHSAANTLLDLAELAMEEPGTEALWGIRRPDPLNAYGAMEEDELPERGKVGLELRHRVDEGQISLVADFRVKRVDGTNVVGVDSKGVAKVVEADEIVVATGQRPDLSITRELRLDLDPALEAPVKLAPLIDPNIHSCLTVPAHGVEQLSHPEPGFYTVGIKSYGRAPTFLMATGYKQIASVVGAITSPG